MKWVPDGKYVFFSRPVGNMSGGAVGRTFDHTVGVDLPALREMPEDPHAMAIQQRILELSRTSPDGLGRLLRSWLHEES